MAGDAKVTFSSREQDVIRAMNEMVKGAGKVVKQMEKISDESKKVDKDVGKAGGSFDKLGGSVTSALGGMATRFLAVGSAIALARKEFESMNENSKAAQDAQIEWATVAEKIKNNFTGSKEDFKKFLSDVKSLSEEVGVRAPQLGNAAVAALSASGGGTAASLEAMRGASLVSGNDAEAISQITGALLDLGKASRSISSDVNMGILNTVGGLSRIETLNLQAKNIPRSLQTQVLNGATMPEAAAFFSAFTQSASDQTGEPTSTFVEQISGQLKEFFTAGKGKSSEEQAGGMTMGERLQTLMEDGTLRKKFLKDATMEARYKAPFESMMNDPESFVSQKYFEFLGTAERQLGDEQQMAKVGSELIGNQDFDPVMAVARKKRQEQVAGENADIEKPSKTVMASYGDTEATFERILGTGAMAHGLTQAGNQTNWAMISTMDFFRGRSYKDTEYEYGMDQVSGLQLAVKNAKKSGTVSAGDIARMEGALRDFVESVKALKESTDANTEATKGNTGGSNSGRPVSRNTGIEPAGTN